MHHNRINLFRTVGFECFGGFGERATGIRHVVDEDGDFTFDVAYEGHFGDFVGAETFFVDEGEGEIETVGDGGGATGQRDGYEGGGGGVTVLHHRRRGRR